MVASIDNIKNGSFVVIETNRHSIFFDKDLSYFGLVDKYYGGQGFYFLDVSGYFEICLVTGASFSQAIKKVVINV